MVLYITPGNPHSGTPGREYWLPSDPQRLTLSINYTWRGAPAIDSTTDLVSFAADPDGEKCTLSSDLTTSKYSIWDWCSVYISDEITKQIVSALKDNIHEALKLVDVNTFALASLLFPNGHTVYLTDVALPRDLYVTGHLKQPITVTPAEPMVAPGAAVQFSAAELQSADILWEITPRIGSISATGLYTAPPTSLVGTTRRRHRRRQEELQFHWQGLGARLSKPGRQGRRCFAGKLSGDPRQ